MAQRRTAAAQGRAAVEADRRLNAVERVLVKNGPVARALEDEAASDEARRRERAVEAMGLELASAHMLEARPDLAPLSRPWKPHAARPVRPSTRSG